MKKELTDKEKEKKIWPIKIFFLTLVLSIIFSYISTNGVSNLKLIPAIIILIIVIFIGIIFDIVGVAVTVANENDFHAKATKKVAGSKKSIKLIKNAPIVQNICSDVIGDICGVLSGSISALIAMKIAQDISLPFNLQVILSAFVSAITVGGKAIGKNFANDHSTEIVHKVGLILNNKEKNNQERRKK